jgi:hypothetical protein
MTVKFLALFFIAWPAWWVLVPHPGGFISAAVGGLIWAILTGFCVKRGINWIVAMGWMLMAMTIVGLMVGTNGIGEDLANADRVWRGAGIVGLIGIGILIYAKWSQTRHE